MRRTAIALCAALACLLAGSAALFGQTSVTAAPSVARLATPQVGFSVQELTSKLSLFLPEDSMRNAPGGFAGAPPAGAGQPGAAAPNGQSGAQGTSPQDASGQAPAGSQPPQLSFKRDPTLFLTRDQITKLLPIFQELRKNPIPSLSKVKQIRSEIDAILTSAQKSEYADYQKAIAAAIEEMQKTAQQSTTSAQSAQRQATQSTQPSMGAPAGAMAFPGSPQGEQQTAVQGSASGAALTTRQLRQRQLDELIAILQARLKRLGA